jgi:hypothetical protein
MLQVPSFVPGTPRHASLDVGNVEDLIERLQQEENIYVQADILNHLHNTWWAMFEIPFQSCETIVVNTACFSLSQIFHLIKKTLVVSKRHAPKCS